MVLRSIRGGVPVFRRSTRNGRARKRSASALAGGQWAGLCLREPRWHARRDGGRDPWPGGELPARSPSAEALRRAAESSAGGVLHIAHPQCPRVARAPSLCAPSRLFAHAPGVGRDLGGAADRSALVGELSAMASRARGSRCRCSSHSSHAACPHRARAPRPAPARP